MSAADDLRELLIAVEVAADGDSNDAHIAALQEALNAALGLLDPEPTAPAHEFTGTVKRADGIQITATLAVPETHAMAARGPARPWQGPGNPNQNFLELGELAMMIAQQGYGVIERNERSRERWGQQDYWADLLNIDPPTPAIEQ